MKKLVLMACCASAMLIANAASAETIHIAGSSGVRDQAHMACSDPVVPKGQMYVFNAGAAGCVIAYPLNIPVGKTIDKVVVAYDEAQNSAFAYITAYLAKNTIGFGGGSVLALGGASTQYPHLPGNPGVPGGAGYLDMGALNVPIQNGAMYWVQIVDSEVQAIDYVAVTYH